MGGAVFPPSLSQRLPNTGRSSSVSCRVTAPFSWVLVHTRFFYFIFFFLSPPRASITPVLWKVCNQIPLTFKVRFPKDSQSPFPDPQVGKSVVDPRTFSTVWEHCMDHNKLWKILKEMGIPDHLTCLLRNLCAGQEATVRIRQEQGTGSNLQKEYVKAVYCHPAHLTFMQSTSWETLGWKKHKQESRLPGEISITSEM